VFDDLFKGKDKQEFFIGTLFPDIRYPTGLGRDETHFKNPSLDQIKKDGPFWAGLKFHSYLDLKWQQYMDDRGYKDLISRDSDQLDRSIKLYQDQLLYDKISNWNKFSGYLNKTLLDHQIFGLKKSQIENWHKALVRYISRYPDLEVISQFSREIGLSDKAIGGISEQISAMKSNKKINQLIDYLYFDL
jgi:hypothetical protein